MVGFGDVFIFTKFGMDFSCTVWDCDI